MNNLSTPSVMPFSKQENIKLLTLRILDERKEKAVVISSFIKSKLFMIQQRKKYLIDRLIQCRVSYAILIQSRYRTYMMQKEIKSILNSVHFFFFYFINEHVIKKLFQQQDNKIKDAKIRFHLNKDNVITSTFSYSKCLQLYYVPLKSKGPLKRRIRVNFIINDQCIIDPRFDVDSNEKGEYCNVIEHSMLYRPMRRRRCHYVTVEQPSKYWENIFQLKKKQRARLDSSSLSNISIDHYLSNNSNMIANKIEGSSCSNTDILKSILKQKQEKENATRNKKVSFNEDVEYGV